GAATGSAAGSAARPAADPVAAQQITVDLATTRGPATGVGAGFLYGLTEDGSGPADDLLAPLAPRSARGGGARLDGGGWVGDGYTAAGGYRRRLDSALAQARRLASAPHHATYDLLVSDVWGADTTQPASTVYPCTGGDCGNWEAFLRRLAQDVAASGVRVRYDVWNEPAGAFFPPGFNTPQYYRMWDTAVRTLRAADPDAVLVGPSLWDFSPGNISPFLDHTKAAGTLPTVLNWHFSGTPVADAATVRSMLADKGIPPLELSMNEYLHADEQHAGAQAWYLAQLAASGIGSASHAIWDACCAAGTLDGILVRDGGVLRPTGQWWVYRGYADLTGDLARVDGGGGTAAVAAVDTARDHAAVLVGGQAGAAPEAEVAVTGLSALHAGSAGLRVSVLRIPDAAPLDQPLTVGSQTLPPGTDSVRLPLTGAAAQDAFLIGVDPAGTPTRSRFFPR
ncbi:beta-xylosidase, partial [Streptomyces sulfonofaciens]|uniref:beta-xylosidase n=1 Tax=Streptomyces sulfonofaciens TaxID=68272 RepID=UPI001671CB4C